MRKLNSSFRRCQNEFHLSVVSFRPHGGVGRRPHFAGSAPRCFNAFRHATTFAGLRCYCKYVRNITKLFPRLEIAPFWSFLDQTKLSFSWVQLEAAPSSTTDVFDIGLLGASKSRPCSIGLEIHDLRRMSSPRRLARKTGLSAEDVEVAVLVSSLHAHWFVSKAEGCPFVISVCLLYTYIH